LALNWFSGADVFRAVVRDPGSFAGFRMKARTHIKCLCCKERHRADPRNAGRQNYCCKPACRKASKAASQSKWSTKPENRDYFRGAENAARVRQWRAANPGYWRRGGRGKPGGQVALQETCNAQTVAAEGVAGNSGQDALQDLCPARNPVLVGLVAVLSGLALQEDIAAFIGKLLSRGEDILRMSPGRPPPPRHENENHPVPGATPACAAPVQLD
jgi:hypothetical protein